MNLITNKQSPNFTKGRKGWKPDLIVCHISEGYETGVDWLCNPKAEASCHYFVAKSGNVYQLVDLRDSSWCNGNTVNSENDKRHYSKATHELVKQRKTSANYYTVTIEFEGFYGDLKGGITQKQLEVGTELIKHIQSEINRIYGVNIPADRKHIIGHYEVNPITKPNCGNGNMPYNEFITRLNQKEVDDVKRYDTIDELPYGRETVEKLVSKGLLKGVNAKGDLGISDDLLRVLVINDRAGLYS